MPLYEYECEECGFKFDQIVSMDGPNPTCPRPTRPKNPFWAKFFLEAKAAFKRGHLVDYPGIRKRVGPDFAHTILHLNQEADPDGVHTEPEPKTLREWVEELFADPPCGGESKRLVSLGNFYLKGGGWADEGYSH